MAQKLKSVQQQYIADKIDMSTKTDIKNSVLHKSPIGAGGSGRPFTICPYCGEELNLPETPTFCPYCSKRLR